MTRPGDEERREFEAWARACALDVERSDGIPSRCAEDYHSQSTDAAWNAWQARASFRTAEAGRVVVAEGVWQDGLVVDEANESALDLFTVQGEYPGLEDHRVRVVVERADTPAAHHVTIQGQYDAASHCVVTTHGEPLVAFETDAGSLAPLDGKQVSVTIQSTEAKQSESKEPK